MFTSDKLPIELITIENKIFALVSDTYDSRKSDAKRVREIFENVVFKDQADVETLTSLGKSEMTKFVDLRALYTKSKCKLAFRNLFIEKLRIFDESQAFYQSLTDLPQPKAQGPELKLDTPPKPVSSTPITPAAAQVEQRVNQFASKRIQAPAPQRIEIDPDEAFALQIQAEWLEEEKAAQKKARTSVSPSTVKPTSPASKVDEIEIYKEKDDIEPVETMDDFALAQKLMDDWNTKDIDPLDNLKKKNVKMDKDPDFMDEMEVANARAIALLLESDVRDKEQAVYVPFNAVAFKQEDAIITDEELARTIQELKKNVYEPDLAQPDENLSRRMAAEQQQMGKESMHIPGVGQVQRTPTACYIDSKSEPHQKLYVRDRAVVEPQTKSVRFECSVGNEITINEDCEIEIVDIQFGTIHITKSHVKIHNATDCIIYVKHNSKVVITGPSFKNTIKYSEDSVLDMSLNLWDGNTITH